MLTLEAQALPPAEFASRIDVAAQAVVGDDDAGAKFTGEWRMSADLDDVDLAVAAQLFPPSVVAPKAGRGDVAVWLELQGGAVKSGTVELALADVPRGTAPARVLKAHMTPEAAYDAMRTFISRRERFDAVFAATDVIALASMRALAASGLSVPDDVAVVGFDDIAMAAHVHPSLTTVRQDLARGSKLLVDLVFRRLDGEHTPSAPGARAHGTTGAAAASETCTP